MHCDKRCCDEGGGVMNEIIGKINIQWEVCDLLRPVPTIYVAIFNNWKGGGGGGLKGNYNNQTR